MKKIFKSKAYKDKLKGHKDGVIKVFAPGGPESGLLLSASKDGCIRAWDLIERKITIKLLLSRDGNEQAQFAYQKDEDQSGDEDEAGITKVDGPSQQRVPDQSQIAQTKKGTQSISDQFTSICFLDNYIFGGFEDGVICQWDLKSGDLIATLKGHTKAITEFGVVNKTTLASSSLDSTIRLWNPSTAMNETIFHLNGPVDLMSVNNKKIEVITSKNTFVEIDVTSQKVTRSVRFTSTSITSFVTHENLLIIGTIQNVMEVYNLEALDQDNLQPLYIVENNKDWILCMKILDGYLYTGGDDRKIKVWDLASKLTLVEDFVGHEDGVLCIEFADNMLYSGSFDHSIRSWNLKEMESRIRERAFMFKEDIWSRKYDAWYKVFYKQKKKKGSSSTKKK